MRQKLGADDTTERKKQRQCKSTQAYAKDDQSIVHCPAKSRPVLLGKEGHYRVVPLLDPVLEKDAGQYLCDQDRKGHRSEKCKRNRPGHWLEQLSLNPLQREDRQVRRDDDGNREKHRTLHFMTGFANQL